MSDKSGDEEEISDVPPIDNTTTDEEELEQSEVEGEETTSYPNPDASEVDGESAAGSVTKSQPKSILKSRQNSAAASEGIGDEPQESKGDISESGQSVPVSEPSNWDYNEEEETEVTEKEQGPPAEGDDFGQAEVQAAKKVEEEIRHRGSWGAEFDETNGEEDEGEMQDMFGKNAAKRNEKADDKDDTQSKRRKKKQGGGRGSHDPKLKKEEAPEDIFVEPTYFSVDFISGPVVTPGCKVYPHVLHVFQSYGYDCVRPYNLHMLDDNTIIYITGNYLHFYRVSYEEVVSIRRSASGYGLGHIAIHPSKKYFAVAEKGDWPLIVIYSFKPEFKVYRVLRRGTERGYSYVDFNPGGDLLCSQGLDPDYLLTIWNWQRERIVLHVKAFSQDIYRATFSVTHPGQLTTCGLGHIRFWKMAETFTGLKLQGVIGRFGKTEISDIQGYAGLQDGKVVSTSEWGNLLVWDGGLIVVEIIQKGGKNCHDGEITNIVLLETGELLTIGFDGYLKTWESEVLDTADTLVDDSGKFEVEPIFECKVATSAKLVSVVKKLGDDESAWLLQDAWGKIWSINIGSAMKDAEYQPGTIFCCPGGAINAICTSKIYTIMAVGTSTGHLWLIEYLTKQTLAKHKYTVAVTRLLWLPLKFDSNGITFLAAFADGNVRLLATQWHVHRRTTEDTPSAKDDDITPFSLGLLQVLRFHKARITVMTLDEEKGILYTCGEDRLIFASRIRPKELGLPHIEPLSYVTAPFPVISLDLHPKKDYRLIIASRTGRIAECRKPYWGEVTSKITYNQGKLYGRRWQYSSVKSHRRREERRMARKLELEKKQAALKEDMADRRAKGLFVEEEVEINRLIDGYRREQMLDDEDELYMPEKPCPVYHVYYAINKSISRESTCRNFFVHVGGYDSGYVYECKCSRSEAGGFHSVPPTPPFDTDVAIRCFICSPDDQYLIFGMEDGTLRVMSRYIPPPPEAVVDNEKKEETAPAGVPVDSLLNDPDEPENSDDNIVADDPQLRRKKKKALPPFPVSVFPYDLTQFVCLPMHDPDRGTVNDLAWSYDGKFLFSVADDGSIFSYRWDPQGVLSNSELDIGGSNVPAEATQIPPEIFAEDTQDPNALTLEELKIKAEKDRLWELAESKKEVLRKKIRDLKSKFRFLLQKNNEIPDEARLPRLRFEMDPAIRQPKKLRLMKGIEEVYRRYEWQSAKSILQIEKLEKYFFAEIETFHLIIKDISHKTQVHTFRQRILTNEFEQVLKQNQDRLVREEIQHQAEMNVVPVDYAVKPAHVTRVYAKELIGDYDAKKYDTKTMQQVRTLEERLRKRFERELRWAELNAQKIPDDYEDPTDIVAISAAKENLGDYKLKSSDDYTGERISAAVRRQRVIDMKFRIHEQIKTFNKYVLDLREEKLQILAECRSLEKELQKIQRQLPPDLQKPIPPIYDMEPIEEPEKLFDITKEMIEIRISKKVEDLGLTQRRQRQKEIEKEELVDKDFRNEKFPGKPKAKKKTKKVEAGPKLYIPRSDKKEAPSTTKARKAFFKPKTSLANVKLELALQFRCFQQDVALRKLNGFISYFHDRVEKIRDERVSLQVDVLLMSMRMLNLIQELDIVKDFDSTEKGVLERFSAQKVETAEAKERMDRAQRRLSRVKQDLGKMEHAITDVQKEVSGLIGEKQKYSEYLWRVYKKKIRIENAGGDEQSRAGSDGSVVKNESSSSSTGDSTDSTSQDSGSDLFKLPKQKLNPNVCPEQLDRNLYEKVCEFRAKRTQLEIEAEAQKKVVEKVERDFTDVEKVYNKYTGRLEGIGEEVLILQRKKQVKMNQLSSLVVLKADQIQCLDEEEFDEYSGSIVQRMKNHFPPLTEVVLFPKDGIGKLDLRIEELKDETKLEREKHKRARHMMVRLREELTKLEDDVGQINTRCKREMIAKFGKLVDLDDVCAAVINLEVLDELTRLETRRNWHYRERKKIADEIEKARDRLTFLTKENSENNTLLAILIERQRDVEYFLYRQHKKEQERMSLPMASNMESSFDFDMEGDLISNEDALEELFNLEDILIRQESRIIILREAIAACKFKSGLPPLIPLRTIKDDVATSFMTMNELYALRDRRNLEVETIFVGKEADTIGDSSSKFPSFATPIDSAAWGEPQLHTPFDANNQVEAPPILPEHPLSDKEEDEETEEDEELFDVSYKPPEDTPTQVAKAEPKETPSYPLNIIPDDQMPAGGEEEEAQKEDEEYEGDPLPVDVPPPGSSEGEE
ncbi:unnamed protein product [Allacma fusca]|uniref:Cilia- and flagella-associated protein 44 n=1 Tax=Allacma fusca TaxID=39272 RepID=A0A8J2K476_9HEXA|nr:unnamed protein product [Allacma fusca]